MWSSDELEIINKNSFKPRIISNKVGKYEIYCDITGKDGYNPETARKVIHFKVSNKQLASILSDIAEYANIPGKGTSQMKKKREDNVRFLEESIVSQRMRIIQVGESGSVLSDNSFDEFIARLSVPKVPPAKAINNIKVHDISYDNISGKITSFKCFYDN